mgnify:CR=1 FL=1
MMDFNFKKDYLSNLDSTYIPHKYIGASTSVNTANQIAEATARLNAGIKGVDISVIDPAKLEMIPKQHFKEINRLMKLTGANPSMHAPIVDLAGFTQQGNWSEENRKDVEKQVNFFVERAHDLNEEGNTPINFHFSTVVPGDNWRKLNKDEFKKLKEEFTPEQFDKLEKEGQVIKKISPDEYEFLEFQGIVNRETGQFTQVKTEKKEYPEGIKVWTPHERLRNQNETFWDEEKLKVFEYQRQKAQVEDRVLKIFDEIKSYKYAEEKRVLTSE